MTTLATILEPGLSTTLQDLGRRGKRHLGVPLSGAADPVSLALANAALGNPSNAAALECTLKGPSLRFEKKIAFALAGADMSARLNDKPTPLYQRIEGKVGDVLTLGAAKAGARCYIAIEGGISGEDFLGSVSAYLAAGLGGIDGRALKSGDVLACVNLETSAAREVPRSMQATFSRSFVVRATAGPESNLLQDGDSERFFAARWTIGRRADRMGAQLDGPRLRPAGTAPMASSPVFPGTVQCPQSGAPFLLMADAQTAGGYPRIAQVIAADLHLTGQLRPGDEVWFRKTSPEEARDIARKKAALFDGWLPGELFI